MDLTEHRKKILGARRRNNIYGEVTDFITIPFLAAGGDGIIYHPKDNSLLIGKSNDNLYLVKILYHLTKESPTPNLSETEKNNLLKMCEVLDATPLYAIAREFSKHTKYHFVNGTKVIKL